MAQGLGRAATIEELEQVRTEMQRLIIRSEVVSQDTYRLTTQLAELYENTDARFDMVDESLGEVKARLGALEEKVDRLDKKVDALAQKLDENMARLVALIMGLAGSRA